MQIFYGVGKEGEGIVKGRIKWGEVKGEVCEKVVSTEGIRQEVNGKESYEPKLAPRSKDLYQGSFSTLTTNT